MKFIQSPFLRPFVWFLTVFFTIFSIPHFELISYEIGDVLGGSVFAMEEGKDTRTIPSSADASQKEGENRDAEASAQDRSKEAPVTAGAGEEGNAALPGLPAVENMIFTGAANAKIPIETPAGRGGIAPNIALTYNSYRSNGWVGMGWDLDMGAIERSTKRGIDYAARDYVAAMNGSRADLVAKPGWGADYYGNKVDENLSKYFRNPSTGGWEVTTKEGTRYYYGSTAASRQDSALGIFKWCLDRVEDTNGNFMTISYLKESGAVYPDGIRYTGNNGIEPVYSVKFVLGDRTDAYPVFPAKFKIIMSKRLKSIEVRAKTVIRSYVLQYQYSNETSRSLLTSVTQYGADSATSLPPVSITWKSSGNTMSARTNWGYSQDRNKTYIGDFNGDGKTDLLKADADRWTVSLSGGDHFGESSLWGTRQGMSVISLGDFNGDGRTDVLESTRTRAKPDVFLSGGSGFLPAQDWGNVAACWMTGDFNGDGKADGIDATVGEPNPFGTVIIPDNNAYVSISQGHRFDFNLWATDTKNDGCMKDSCMMVSDFNGDGKSDFIQLSRGKLDVWISTGSGFSSRQEWGLWFSLKGRSGDFNGDGKEDIVGLNQGAAYVAISIGNSFEPFESWGHDNQFISDTYDYTYFVDLNGDSKTDIFQSDANGNGWVWLSNGKDFNSPILWTTRHFNWNIRNAFRFGDFNGDGKTDILQIDSSGNVFVWLSNPPSDLVESIKNPMGGSAKITYRASSEYQNTKLPVVLQTVASIEVSDGRGKTSITNYKYQGGYYDYADREFRGFEKVTSETSDAVIETIFHQDAVRKGKIFRQTITSREGHTKSVENNYQIRNLDGDAGFPALQSTATTSTDVGAPSFSLTRNFSYDDYLNVYQTVTSGTESDTIMTETDYTDFPDKWIVSKPTRVTVRNGAGQIVSRKWMGYDPGTGNLMTEEVCRSDNPQTGCENRYSGQNPRVTYTYYPEGNLETVTDPLNHFTAFTYDDTRTHVYEKTNALGHKTTTVYNEAGKLRRMVPPHLQGTSYSFDFTYDALWRMDTETRPDGGWTRYEYHNLGNPAAQYIQIQEHIEAAPPQSYPDFYSFAFFDGLGRTWQTQKTWEGKYQIVNTYFDDMGRVVSRSTPFFHGETEYRTSFTYDGFSRPLTVTAPDNSTVSTNYQGLAKTVADQNGHNTAYTYDVYQRLRRVQDHRGTVTEYSYDILGNLLEVIAAKGLPGQNKTTMTYDSLSKKRTMNDPDMGYWTYDYDKLGNLISQTDAKGQQITFTYDELGRLTKKNFGAEDKYAVTYTYDDPAVPYSLGKLTKMSTRDGVDEYQSFDVMQRPTLVTKTVKTQSRSMEKTYDSAGRTALIQYFSGTSQKKLYYYYYDRSGNLIALKDSQGKSIVEYSSFTALGQPQEIIYPKGNDISVKTIYTCTPQTGRVETLKTRKMKGSAEMAVYQDLEYAFDPNGNLKQINDKKDGTLYSYSYDGLDRLAIANAAGTRPYHHEYSYDSIGNIKIKYDVGAYHYDYADKPHAVRSAGRISLEYDANGNMISRSEAGGASLTIHYTPDNKPSAIYGSQGETLVSFGYDGSGNRVYKKGIDSFTFYFGEFYEQKNGVDIYHLFGNGRVVSIRLDGAVQFYHPDHLGSTAVVTDANGDLRQEIGYFPFGTHRYSTASGSYPRVNYTFTGQEEDDEIGLYNYKARLYDPVLGRFISADGLVPQPGNLQSLNRYSYCINNPLKYTDPSGHFWEIVVGAVIGALVTGIQSGWDPQSMAVGAVIGGISGGVYSGVSGAVGGSIGGSITNATVAGAISGAAGGAAAGGLSAAYYGGDIGDSMLRGAGLGAVGGAAFGGIGGYFGKTWNLYRVGAYTIAGGGVSELAGQGFEKGALFAGATAFARFAYNEWVGYDVTWDKGGEARPKGFTTMPYRDTNNIGVQGKVLSGNSWDDMWLEGGPVSRAANHILGVNAVAGMHDVFQIKLDACIGGWARTVFNVPAMIPATVLTTSGLLADPRAVMLYLYRTQDN